MRLRAAYLVILTAVIAIVVVYAFRRATTRGQSEKAAQVEQPKQDNQRRVESSAPLIPLSDRFVYPIDNKDQPGKFSQAKDGDGWYNAQDFGENNHLGEDWNAESGGNSDCGKGVYAASNGTIVFAADAGIGWGNVVIVRHRLPDNTLVETLYGHLQTLAKVSGDVQSREQIGSIGDANGAYPCHLHFELRLADCPSWGAVGPGYSENRTGWTDPSNFIDTHRSQLP